MERLIIDTDPGVDDAQAILMAAAHPNAKIEALMAVGGNVGLEHTLRNSLTLTEIVEQHIPVYAGCDQPLVIFQEDAAFVHGQDGLGDVGLAPKHRQSEIEHASIALVRMVNESPGEYTLAAIGPLTNIAVALKLDPQLPAKLKRFIVMGGAVTAHGNTSNVSAEFNIYFDPEAGHVVFKAWEDAGKLIELIDWEATMRHPIDGETLNRWLNLGTIKSEFFKNISAATREFIFNYMGRSALFAADPLALAVALEPEKVTKSETRHVTVEINGLYARGQTIVDWHQRGGGKPNAQIILDYDIPRFIALMEQGLT